jgi:hypothetical protein
MGLLAHVLRLSGPTHGRPPCSFLPSLGDMVPVVPNLVSSPECLASKLNPSQPDLPSLVKLSRALSDLE